jgi:hypothetical protein
MALSAQRVLVLSRSASRRWREAGWELVHQFLGYENVTEYTRERYDQDHLQHDADTRNITAGLAERTTQQ